jgi:uncharacterized C2H2 Zn-finger protein
MHLPAPSRRRLPADDALFNLGDLARAAVAAAHAGELQHALAAAARLAAAHDVRPFVCGIDGCTREITSLLTLERHVRSEHGAHRCTRCGAGFTSERLATVHAQEAHDALFALLAARRDDMFVCLLERGCDRRFRTAAGRRRHMVDAHMYPPTFVFGAPPSRRRRVQEQRPPSDGRAPLPGEEGGGGGGAGGGGRPGPYHTGSSAATPPRSQPCRFFGTPGGCRSGASCRFAHEPVTVAERPPAAAAASAAHPTPAPPPPSTMDVDGDDDVSSALGAAFSSMRVGVPDGISFGKRGGRGGRGRR